MKAKLILLSGKMGHGKTTAAAYLEKHLGGVIRRKSFAGPLKLISQAFGLTKEQCYGTLEDKQSLTNWKWKDLNSDLRNRFETFNGIPKSEFLTARQFMQVFGTDVIRNGFCKDAWVQLMHNEIAKEAAEQETYGALLGSPKHGHTGNCRCPKPVNQIYFLIDDCRMPNELVNHPSVETIKVRIIRPGMPISTHESETALDAVPDIYYDFIINNDGDMLKYESSLSKLLEKVRM